MGRKLWKLKGTRHSPIVRRIWRGSFQPWLESDKPRLRAPCAVLHESPEARKQPALAAQQSTLRSPLEAWGWDSCRKCHPGLDLSWEYDRLCLCILQKACFPDSGGPSEVGLIGSTHLRTLSGSFAEQNLPLAKKAIFLCI